MAGLMDDLLELTRLEAHAIQLHTELQPIEDVIGVALGRMERAMRNHPVASHIDDGLPPVAIDELLMQQVLTNLLDNAVKFSPPGSTIDLSCRRDGPNLVLAVADRGPGVPPDETQRIFDKFHSVPGQARSGSGIGLAICRGITELHGGSICVENRPGGGAIFRLTLPLADESRLLSVHREG